LEDPLAEEVLRGSFPEGTKVLVQMKDGHVYFEGSHEETAAPAAGKGKEPPAEAAGAAADTGGKKAD
jgi:hypothetical protein